MLPEIPFFDGFWYLIALLIAMVLWRIWGDRAVTAVRRFDQRRRDADLQAYADRMNPNAHFRQSVDQISEATPPVEPHADGTADWNGKNFLSREEAEAARWRHVMTEARAYYIDLDRAYGHRIKGPTGKGGAGDTN